MSAVDMGAGDPLSSQPAQITLSGIEGGHFKVARLDLVPRSGEHGLVYDEKNLSVSEVKDVLIYTVAGCLIRRSLSLRILVLYGYRVIPYLKCTEKG